MSPVQERRANKGGTQRVVRLTAIYLGVLAAMYGSFVGADLVSYGAANSATRGGTLILSGIFALFAAVGALYTLSPAPRSVELAEDRLVVVGRWGRRRRFPPIGRLSTRVIRRYSEGWLQSEPVELLEVWGDDVPVRGYIASEELFAGATPSSRDP